MAQPSGLLTVAEVAKLFLVDDTTVRRWIKYGALEAVYLPHQGLRNSYRVKKETLLTLGLDPDAKEELMTVREVAKRLRVDDTTVRRWMKYGVLERITLPHRGKREQSRIKRNVFEALVGENQPA